MTTDRLPGGYVDLEVPVCQRPLTVSPEGMWIVFGAAFPMNLLTRRMLAKVPRAIRASLPRRDPNELNSLGVSLPHGQHLVYISSNTIQTLDSQTQHARIPSASDCRTDSISSTSRLTRYRHLTLKHNTQVLEVILFYASCRNILLKISYI